MALTSSTRGRTPPASRLLDLQHFDPLTPLGDFFMEAVASHAAAVITASRRRGYDSRTGAMGTDAARTQTVIDTEHRGQRHRHPDNGAFLTDSFATPSLYGGASSRAPQTLWGNSTGQVCA